MRLIVTSREDIASMNIRKHLLSGWEWKEVGTFESDAIFVHDDYLMVTIPEIHLDRDNIDRQVTERTGEKFEVVIFASRHRAESKLPTLTVHPIGNYSKAEFGGLDRTLVSASPHLMTSALRLLRKLWTSTGFGISFETTHHGPYLDTPSFFIEIGSDESLWTHEEAAKTIAKVIMTVEEEKGEIVMCVGGGHYAPRFTDMALENPVSIAHMAANYALDALYDERVMAEMIEKSGKPKFVYFHRKSMQKQKFRELSERFGTFGIETVRSDRFSE
ncbi:MAG: D-aminoacyl-tRNA deacylase [Thermoplasmata archaeon]